jgi:uncharacterized protein (TIGR03067 family)
MRSLLFILMLIISQTCFSQKNNTMKSTSINGTWIPVKQEIGGKSLPAALFEKQTLTINDSLYVVVAESTDKGLLQYKEDKMDIYGKEGVNAGKHFTALFKNDNDQLTICYNLAGDSYPESFDTNGKPLYFLSVFRKASTK